MTSKKSTKGSEGAKKLKLRKQTIKDLGDARATRIKGGGKTEGCP